MITKGYANELGITDSEYKNLQNWYNKNIGANSYHGAIGGELTYYINHHIYAGTIIDVEYQYIKRHNFLGFKWQTKEKLVHYIRSPKSTVKNTIDFDYNKYMKDSKLAEQFSKFLQDISERFPEIKDRWSDIIDWYGDALEFQKALVFGKIIFKLVPTSIGCFTDLQDGNKQLEPFELTTV